MSRESLNEDDAGAPAAGEGGSNVTDGVKNPVPPFGTIRRKSNDETIEEMVESAFSGVDLFDLPSLVEAFNPAHLQRGESRGRHYKDHNGYIHDDEGNVEHESAYNKRPAAPRSYHQVPFHQKDSAKKEGMRWDAGKKKWYHTDAHKSKNSAFKLHESKIEIAVPDGPHHKDGHTVYSMRKE